MIKNIYLLFIFFTLFFAIKFSAIGQDEFVRGNGWEALRHMKSEGVLIVYYYENQPFIYKNEDDELTGIEYDILQQFRNYLQAKYAIKFKIIWKKAESTKEFLKNVQRGDRGSIGVGAVMLTEQERADHFKYSPPYMADVAVIITSDKVKDFTSPDEFRKLFSQFKAVTIDHSEYEKYLEQLQKVFLPNLTTQFVRNNDEIIQTISNASNTFAYVQMPSYLLALKKGLPIKRHKTFMQTNSIGYGFLLPAKTAWDEPLKEFFNNSHFKDSVKIISEKYLGADVSEFVTEIENTENGRTAQGDEIAILDKENTIKQLRLKEQELAAEKARTTRNFIIGLTTLLVMLAAIFYFRYRAKKKAHELVSLMNAELTNKNEEILQQAEEILQQRDEIDAQRVKLAKMFEHISDSVRYASRIQETILPDKEHFVKSFADAFIYFHPKDELSGDFYWYSEVDNLKIVACIDCTGHSIPGAFMTVMANTLINNIIKEQKILSPEKILMAMDNGVQNNMNKQQKNAKRQMHDGMDMAICVIDESKQTLTFASANQSICRVTDGELLHLKGSSFPIGGFQFDEKSYKEEVIHYQTGDMFYMYSDGYQDQFGGAEGRKYMSKRFREYLKQISHLTAEAQEAILLREYQMWRGMRTQTDDQLIIGFRL